MEKTDENNENLSKRLNSEDVGTILKKLEKNW